MRNSTNLMNETFDQDAYDHVEDGLEAGFDDFLFEQLEEVDTNDLDYSDLDDLDEDGDNFDGIF